MINRKVFTLIALLSFWLFAAACTAVSEPTVVDETAVAPSTTAPTVETAALPTPTPPTVPTVDAEPTAAETAPPDTPDTDLMVFTTSLRTAVVGRDFEFMQTTMSDPFGFGGYRSEWQLGTPEDFLPQIENMLPAGANLQFTPNPDFSTLLGGQDPQMMMGPDVTVAAVWHVTGWGAEGKDEAIFFVEEMVNGRFAWKALLYAPDGFLPKSAELPVPAAAFGGPFPNPVSPLAPPPPRGIIGA